MRQIWCGSDTTSVVANPCDDLSSPSPYGLKVGENIVMIVNILWLSAIFCFRELILTPLLWYLLAAMLQLEIDRILPKPESKHLFRGKEISQSSRHLPNKKKVIA